MMDINLNLLHWSINFLKKKTTGRKVKNENVSKKECAEELHKSTIRKFKKRKVHSTFIDNIWGTDQGDM